jgi:hypothetical protein
MQEALQLAFDGLRILRAASEPQESAIQNCQELVIAIEHWLVHGH